MSSRRPVIDRIHGLRSCSFLAAAGRAERSRSSSRRRSILPHGAWWRSLSTTASSIVTGPRLSRRWPTRSQRFDGCDRTRGNWPSIRDASWRAAAHRVDTSRSARQCSIDSTTLGTPASARSRTRSSCSIPSSTRQRRQRLRPWHPPTLILHGKADALPIESVERFCAKARALQGRCDVIGFEDADHGFFERAAGRSYREGLLEMERFLTGLGFLSKGAGR